MTKPTILKTEAHLHLYGCLTAEDLWFIGRDRFSKYEDRLSWYAIEYENAWGRRPDVASYWRDDNGPEIMAKDFLFDAPGNFPQFQAKFNLLIALCPANPEDLTLAEHVFRRDTAEGGTKEYRTFLPAYLDKDSRTLYLRNLLNLARNHTTKNYRPLIALSCVRTSKELMDLYPFIQNFLKDHPELSSLVTGIDFCGSEVGFPPSDQRDFLAKVIHDRNKGEHQLDVLYHVGEMWSHISLASAARWVAESVLYGVKRVGHGMALGLDPEALRGKSIEEPLAEAAAHRDWMTRYQSNLAAFGLSGEDLRWFHKKITTSTGNIVTWDYNDNLIVRTRRFQDALLGMVKEQDPIIEVCPTSNLRIGEVPVIQHHPLQRFLNAGLKVIISTDDPGIFGISLGSEESLLRQGFGCTDNQMRQFENNAANIFAR